MDDTYTIGFLMFMGFVASFVDAVAGGGGLIMIPTLLGVGIPPITALGTNKLAFATGGISSFIAFMRSGKVDIALIRILFPIAFVGALCGVMIVQQIPSDFLQPLVIGMLVIVAIYSVCKKDWGSISTYHGMTKNMRYMSFALTFIIGVYNGFFGPGTGSFLIFAFLFAGFDYLGAAANARLVNFSSDIASASLYVYFGNVDFHYAIPIAVAIVAGAFCGARMAISRGTGYVRPLFIVMTTVLIGKQLWNLISL